MIEQLVPEGALATAEKALLGGVDRVNEDADMAEQFGVGSADLCEPFEDSFRLVHKEFVFGKEDRGGFFVNLLAGS